MYSPCYFHSCRHSLQTALEKITDACLNILMGIHGSVLILDNNIEQLQYLSNLLVDIFEIYTAENLIDAQNLFKKREFVACVINSNIPNINIFNFIHSLKSQCITNTSYFIWNSSKYYNSNINTLKLGIRDFLDPEMSQEEIIIRIKNQIKSEIRYYKDIKIDLNNFNAFVLNKKIELTLIEFKILSHLLKSPNKTIPRETLINFTWPSMLVLDKTLNTHLSNLRIKIANSNVKIKSIKSEGIILL